MTMMTMMPLSMAMGLPKNMAKEEKERHGGFAIQQQR
jgi:hypothetical protein